MRASIRQTVNSSMECQCFAGLRTEVLKDNEKEKWIKEKPGYMLYKFTAPQQAYFANKDLLNASK